jgi:two-component system, NtrC family, sensor histidine kinase HydH
MEHLAVTSVPHDAAKQVQEKQILLSRLLARLAHEVRNPLSSLNIHVQLLEEDMGHIPAELRARSALRFRTIRTELERLDSLVKQFLTLAGRSSVNPQLVDVTKIAEHVCALVRPEAAVHGIDLEWEGAADLPPIVADPDQLTQALLNLVLNAVQAVGRDGLVMVSAELAAENERMALVVRDTGPGIDPNDEATLFEPFYTTKEDGSGLGLWIVRQIAVAHGGTARVENAPAGGAIFTLELPVQGKEAGHG